MSTSLLILVHRDSYSLSVMARTHQNWWKRSQLIGRETMLLAPLPSPDARLQIRLNRLVLNRWVLAESYSTTKCVLLNRVSEGNEDLTYGAVGCNFPSFGVVPQQLQLSFRRLPHWIFLSNTWCFREFLHYVSHKATYEYTQHLFFYRKQCFYSGKDALYWFKATAKTYKCNKWFWFQINAVVLNFLFIK